MAKAKSQSVVSKKEPKLISRPGVHAKTKTSKNKKSKLYRKINIGQG
jgi:hypothetical protein